MPDPTTIEEYAMKILPVIYVLDTGGSMTGNRIQALNQAMNETMSILKEMDAKAQLYYKIKISVLTSGDYAKWVTNGLEDLEEFTWNGIEAGGMAMLGAALKELDHKMSRYELFQSDMGYRMPILIFIGRGTSADDWKGALEKIQHNKWFRLSTKIAIAIGNPDGISVLTEIVDHNPKAVIFVDDVKMIENLMPDITMTAVQKRSSMLQNAFQKDAAGEIVGYIKRKSGIGELQIDNPADDSIKEVTERIPRKVIPVIFVLDVSESMEGSPIEDLKTAMDETRYILQEMLAEDRSAFTFKIGILTFADKAEWITHKLESIEDLVWWYEWGDIKAGGTVVLGSALRELNHKMSRNELFQSDTGVMRPIVIFMSNGIFTDNWEEALETINRENRWFAMSVKAVIALDEQADRSVLTKIADNDREAVFSVDEIRHALNWAYTGFMIIGDRVPKSYHQENAVEVEGTETELDTNAPQLDDLDDGWDW